MKAVKRILIYLLAMIVCIGMMTIHAFAASSTQDGLEVMLTTDKEEYSQGEQITATLTVTNTNEVAVSNISLESMIPEGYMLADGSESTKEVESLGAGETVALTVIYVADSASSGETDPGNGDGTGIGDNSGSETENQPETGDNSGTCNDSDNRGNTGTGNNSWDNSSSNQNSNQSNSGKPDSVPKTGDNANIVLWVVLLVLACSGIVVLIALKKKSGKKLLSLFLCVAMVGTMVVDFLPAHAYAVENSNYNRSIDVSTLASVNGSDITIEAKVSYTYEPTTDSPASYTRGEWINMLAEAVGMNLSAASSDIDYYYVDTVASPYGIAIETAQAYGILPQPDIEDLEQDIPFFYPDETATREFAAYTAVHAMGFDGTYSYDTSTWGDWDQIQYQDEAAVAVGNGFLCLNANMKFNPTAPLSDEDIGSIFATIDAIKLADETIDENVYDDSQYAEGVLKDELSSVTNYTVIENGDGTYTVYINKSDITSEISAGSVIVLPANSTYITGIALKVTAATENDTQLILICIEPGLAEVFTKIDFAGGGIALVGDVVGTEGVEVEYNPNGSLDGEYAIALARNINVGGSIKVPGTFKFNIGEGKKITDNLKVSGSVEVEIPQITCIADIDVGWLNVSVNEFTVSVSEKIKINGKLEYTLTESGYQLSNGQFERGRVELGRVPIAIGTTGLSFDFVFFYNFEAKGSASITYTIESTQGYQYKNGFGRSLFDYNDSLDFIELKGSAKAGLGVAGDLCAFTIFDLVGYSGEAGVAFNASITPHVLSTDTLFCGDVTLYAYAKHGLDQETFVGEFLKNVCHYTLEFEPLKSNSSNPFKLKFHTENGFRVTECSFGMGGITGYVCSLDEKIPLRDARVNIYSDYSEGNDLLRTLYTNADGMYSIDNLTEGTYRVAVSATGYFTYEATVTVEHNQMTYIENLLMVDRGGSGEASLVTGTIVDAITGYGITNTTYVLRNGWYNRTGDGIASGIFEDSSYSMTLGVGNYTLEISKEGYVANYSNIAVSENACTSANIILSPVNGDAVDEELRIVLTWGKYPKDLDSHLVCVSEDSYHTYFSNMEHYNDSVVANLDIDDIASYGPETITVYRMRAGDNFSFYVHDYTNRYSNDSSEMSNSGARVQVYLGGVNIATYSIPANRGGTLWHVFDFEAATGTITPVNIFSYHEDPKTVGPINAANLRMIDSGIFADKIGSDAEEVDVVAPESAITNDMKVVETDINAEEMSPNESVEKVEDQTTYEGLNSNEIMDAESGEINEQVPEDIVTNQSDLQNVA